MRRASRAAALRAGAFGSFGSFALLTPPLLLPQSEELAAAADLLVHRALRSVAPLRAAQLLLSLYRGGAFGATKLARSPQLAALARGTAFIDARDMRADTLALFLLLATSHAALSRALGSAENADAADARRAFPPSGTDLWVVAGHGANRASERAAHALRFELSGGSILKRGLICQRTPRALHLSSSVFEAWIAQEADFMKEAARERYHSTEHPESIGR